ncbi:hypothetical protein [Curtobacterium flaccumfaciens]|uniref:hypothetical protein n=1 Tax=Curtobacterium flaccumfaciens TaxID=2035 RepID=UPI003879714F
MQLAESTARNTATMVMDKIRALRERGRAQDTIDGLSEIVSDLIADKNELALIAQSYQQELVAQRITDAEVAYIAGTLVPLLLQLGDNMEGEEGVKFKKQVEQFKPLLSVETVNLLQILGFDFRRAIGQPLTRLVESLINAQSPEATSDVEAEQLKAQQAIIGLAMDPDAFARFQGLS